MKDIICNAYFTPEYVYDYWFNCFGTPLDKEGLDNWDIWWSEEWYYRRIQEVEHHYDYYDSTSKCFRGFKTDSEKRIFSCKTIYPTQFFEAGYVYAPYIPFVSIKTMSG